MCERRRSGKFGSFGLDGQINEEKKMLSSERVSIASVLIAAGLLFGLVIANEATSASRVRIITIPDDNVGNRTTPQGLNPAALSMIAPDKLKWTENPENGVLTSYVLGDADKPGLYIALVKWRAHHMSHPHFHPNDRFITVLSGTWWVGTGSKFDPDHVVPLRAGSFVTHYGKQVHYDGAKDEDCMLEVVGMGPATVTPAEEH
jgi:hypothetical protein